MNAYQLTITPKTAFGGKILGATLFGQICWAIAERYGDDVLSGCLKDYANGKPFLVVSDAFPTGFLPMPTMPSDYWQTSAETDRKILKKQKFISVDYLENPPKSWQQNARDLSDKAIASTHLHNSINRQTNTTGDKEFAPYQTSEIWFVGDLSVYLLLDENRLSFEQLKQVIDDIAKTGYGRDASVGLGKFEIIDFDSTDLFSTDLFEKYNKGKDALSLSACCPQGLGFDKDKSFYQIHSHFGRHGNLAVHGGNPFKKPVLMANTGAVFHRENGDCPPFIGQGILGVSAVFQNAVHQGYAPCLWFDFGFQAA